MHANRHRIWASSRRMMVPACSTLQVGPQDVESLAHCTPLQQGMLARSLNDDNQRYYTAFHYQLTQDVSLQQLKEAWKQAHSHLALLRTQFVPTDAGYVQVARRSIDFPWLEKTLPKNVDPQIELRNTYSAWCKSNSELITRPFEVIVCSHGNKRIMAIHMFHALYDAISLELLLDCVTAAYHGNPVEYGPAFFDVLPYGPLLKLHGAKEFWEKQLRHLKAKASPSISSSSITIVRKAQVNNLQGLESRRRELSVTLQALIQASWMATLTATQKGLASTGLITSGRSMDFPNIDKVIGPIFNTLPFSLSLHGHDTWKSIILTCHRFNTAVMPFQHTPLRKVHKWLNVPADGSLFDNIFVFQRSVSSEALPPPWEFEKSLQATDYPIACEVEQDIGDALLITIVAQSGYIDHNDVQVLLETLQTSLTALAADPEAQLCESIDVPSSDDMRTPKKESVQNREPPSQPTQLNDVDSSLLSIIQEEIASLAGLEAGSIRPDHSIMKLGLDSIDAVKLSSRLTHRIQRVTVSQIMKASTVQRISEILQSSHAGHRTGQETHDLQRAEASLVRILGHGQSNGFSGDRYLPTSPLQDAMMAAMIATDLEMYLNHDVLRLAPDTDTTQLLHAIDAVVKANPIWRTTFIAVDDPKYDHAYAQVVHPPGRLTWDSCSSGNIETVSEVIDHVHSMVRDDKKSNGFFHATVVQSGGDRHLVLSIAHALYDGWSLALLHQDIWDAYNGRQTQRPSYDGVLAALMAASTTDEAATFWNAQLHDALPSALPLRANCSSNSQGFHRLEIASHVSATAFKEFCRHHGVTAQAFTSTCWALVLAHRLRSLEVVFGIVLSGRDTSEANEVMFPTMNTVAFRCYMYGSASELLSQTQEDLTTMREHQHFPLAKAIRFADVEGQGLFNSLFIYQARPDGDKGREKSLYASSQTVSNVDMPVCVEAELDQDALIWRIACADEIFSHEEAETLLQDLNIVIDFLMQSDEGEVIEEVDEGFSFAGLPPVQLEEFQNGSLVDASSTSSEPESSFSQTEQAVSKIMSSIAQVSLDSITKETTLYNIGLDSISAIKVSRTLRSQGMRISVSHLLRLGSVAKISSHIDTAVESKDQDGINGVNGIRPAISEEQIAALATRAGYERRDVQTVEPATAGQVYMLSAWLNSRGTLFFPEFRYHLSTTVSFVELENAWSILCAESPILRTCFVATGSEDEPFKALIMTSAKASFERREHDLGDQSQPYAALTVEHQGSQWLLKLKIHHALYDAVSLPTLIRRLGRLCNLNKAKDQPEANDLQILRRFGGSHSEAHGFWTTYLKGAPSIKSIPLSKDGKRVESFDAQLIQNVKPLQKACNTRGISVHAAFLAAYAKLYKSKMNTGSLQQDIVLGIYLANRSHDISGLTEAAVPTVNLVPLRVRKADERSLEDLSNSIQQDLLLLNSLENASTSLWQIARWTNVKIDTFVNFLVLPESADDDGSQVNGQDNEKVAHIQPSDKKREESYSRLVQTDTKDWAVPQALKSCPDIVLDVYGVSECADQNPHFN